MLYVRKCFLVCLKKHHCRVCGGFCANCADKWCNPKFIAVHSNYENSVSSWLSYDEIKKNVKNVKIKQILYTNLLDTFIFLPILPIELKDLYELRLVNKLWCNQLIRFKCLQEKFSI